MVNINFQQRQAELIDRIVAEAQEKLAPERVGLAEKFIRLFFAHVPPDDLMGEEPDNLFGAAMTCLRLASARKPGQPNLRVYNPHYDEAGWTSPHTIVEIVNDDMPFLVRSVTAALNRHELTVHFVIHPMIVVRRDSDGTLLEILDKAPERDEEEESPPDIYRESIIQAHITEQTGPATLQELLEGLQHVLADVRAAVDDWKSMRRRVAEVIADLSMEPPPVPAQEINETKELLYWIDNDHFTFLGYRDYAFSGSNGDRRLDVVSGTGLGLLRDDDLTIFDGLRTYGKLPGNVTQFVEAPKLLRINKANRVSTVHRPVHMDALFIKRFGPDGRPVGERLFVGLFTSIAYSRSPHSIPVLRNKVERIIQRAGLPENGHDVRALAHILDTYPRDELFQIDEDTLFETAMGILHLQERQRIALFLRMDPFERFVSCLVYVPRDNVTSELRVQFQAILEEAWSGSVSAFYTHLGDEILGRLHYLIRTTPGAVPEVDAEALEARLVEAGRSWTDRLRAALTQAHGEAKGLALMCRYGSAFPTSYRERFDARNAVRDIDKIERVLATGTPAIHLYTTIEAEPTELKLKIVGKDNPIALSDILPILEHLGLRVIGEVPFEIRLPRQGGQFWVHEFGTVIADGNGVDLSEVREKFEEAAARVWHRDMEDDGFNGLVLRAGLSWREVIILRAYARFLRQAAFTFSQNYMESTLNRYPEVARLLVDLFFARFDPGLGGGCQVDAGRLGRIQDVLEQIEAQLDDVVNLDDDRILRQFMNLIQATLRTNYFQSDGGAPKSYVSYKLDSAKIPDLPKPRPWKEIFVYSLRMEGVHLRGGKVARGGLRWSDRREDFRTEILGLMKAQMVKNAVIVPVGSKGGFVVKSLPPTASREEMQAEGIACYKMLIRGLLDLTDNLDGTAVVPPPKVVRHDADDPYLVVAADKGTATFSDIANGVAEEYGYWLGDAFASGGSAGYDHKKMGITARGAWESVKRHFREMGTDCQSQDFTVIGIGDMSGDVFGNGMLLSRHIRLIAAFNHLHIFFDPDPDAAKSYQERERLFNLPRSSWADYDPGLISGGGGVFERRAKWIPVSAEMRKLLGLTASRVTPNDMIRAILKAPTDLIWFGGIGTYIKSEEETHLAVGDRANDAIRVDACHVKAKVIGEGANLGVTQMGRIAFALGGGRINTDAIDNSAGVDCSDHEVNIKILLSSVEAAGDMTRKQRDQLLEAMTDEVAKLVLLDNFRQSLAITMLERQAFHLLDQHGRFLRKLERAGRLDRSIEFLPDEEELADRRTGRRGLSRPELSVVLAYAKIDLYDALLQSDLPDDPLLVADLMRYFPVPLRDSHAGAIEQHRLRREIIATYVTNSMVNRVGASFVSEMQDRTGLEPAEIARAYTVVRDIFGFRELWAEIDSLEHKLPADLQLDMLSQGQKLIERSVAWFLSHADHPIDVSRMVEEYKPGIATLSERMDVLISNEARATVERRAADFEARQAPPALARRVAELTQLSPAMDIVRISSNTGLPVEEVGCVYLHLGATFSFDWLRQAAHAIASDSLWQEMAVQSVIEDLVASQTELTNFVLRVAREAGFASSQGAVDRWIEANKVRVDHAREILEEMRGVATVDVAMLTVANRELRNMIRGRRRR